MRTKHFFLACAALALLTLLPTPTRADNLTFHFTPPTYTASAGSVVTLIATFNNGPGDIFFLGYEATLQSGLSLSPDGDPGSQPFDSLGVLAGGASTGPIAVFNILIAAGTPAGTVFSFAGNEFRVTYLDSTGLNEVIVASQFQITVDGTTAVPEPVSLVLLGSGLAGLAARMRKRRRSVLNS